MNKDYIIYQTTHKKLRNIVDFFFYVDIPSIEMLQRIQEDVIPYPRVTLGYFFNHPFSVSVKNKNTLTNFITSRIITKKVLIQSQSNQVKIMGVHLKPYALSLFTNKRIKDLPIPEKVENIFNHKVAFFIEKIEQLSDVQQQFQLLENLLLENLQTKDLHIIIKASEMIEQSRGTVKIAEIAKELNISTRTLRNHFYQHIGCSPKEYIQVVKLHKSVGEIKTQQDNLTAISYDNGYFDQAHFIKSIKNITGKTPKILRQENSAFRFIQF